jgi:hypothetical protein
MSVKVVYIWAAESVNSVQSRYQVSHESQQLSDFDVGFEGAEVIVLSGTPNAAAVLAMFRRVLFLSRFN